MLINIDLQQSCSNRPCDFTQHLPTTVSEEIFSQLDVCSLCSANQVSRRWNHIINDSDFIWRNIYNLMEENCTCGNVNQLPYKCRVSKRYVVLKHKRRWLNGEYSFISSLSDLSDARPFCKFSKNDWGEIFQRELDRQRN